MDLTNITIFGISGKILLLFVLIIGGIAYIIYNHGLKETLQNKESKVLNYYGGNHCPHSRIGSSMYDLISNNFHTKYPNVSINYYWSGEADDEFIRANIEYVPTITNNYNQQLFIGLPEGNVPDDKSDQELEQILLDNIYNQL
jgi:hypothetical protein